MARGPQSHCQPGTSQDGPDRGDAARAAALFRNLPTLAVPRAFRTAAGTIAQRYVHQTRLRQMYIMPMPAAATLVVSWLTMFLVGTELFVFSPLLPMLAADYGVSPMLAGWCVTAFSLTYMGSALLLGYVSDRVGRRRVQPSLRCGC